MTTDEHIQQFLDAEDQASRLVDELSKLREATGNYTAAGQALDDAAGHLGSTSASLIKIAEGVRDTTSTLREIGMPEILAAQDSTKSEISSLRQELGGLKRVSMIGTAALAIALVAVLILQLAS